MHSLDQKIGTDLRRATIAISTMRMSLIAALAGVTGFGGYWVTGASSISDANPQLAYLGFAPLVLGMVALVAVVMRRLILVGAMSIVLGAVMLLTAVMATQASTPESVAWGYLSVGLPLLPLAVGAVLVARVERADERAA